MIKNKFLRTLYKLTCLAGAVGYFFIILGTFFMWYMVTMNGFYGYFIFLIDVFVFVMFIKEFITTKINVKT